MTTFKTDDPLQKFKDSVYEFLFRTPEGTELACWILLDGRAPGLQEKVALYLQNHGFKYEEK